MAFPVYPPIAYKQYSGEDKRKRQSGIEHRNKRVRQYMERAHRDAERYHEDHYNPAFYVKERKRAVLLFLLFSDTFGVLVIKPFENKQKEEKEHDCGLSYLEKPVLGICQPCHYSYPEDIDPGYNPYHSGGNKQYFSIYSVFHVSVLYNPADTGNKDSENMFVNSYCVPCWRSVVCMYQ